MRKMTVASLFYVFLTFTGKYVAGVTDTFHKTT